MEPSLFKRFGLGFSLLAAASASAIEKYACTPEAVAAFRKATQRGGADGAFSTALRTEDKRFATSQSSDNFQKFIKSLVKGREADHGLLTSRRREMPPEDMVFDTGTLYVAAKDGKFRGRGYKVGNEADILDGVGLKDFKTVQIAETVRDEAGQPMDLIKLEMKVRFESSEANPFGNKVVAKPGILMTKKDFDLLLEKGSLLSSEELSQIHDRTLAIEKAGLRAKTPHASPESYRFNKESDVDFLLDSYRAYYAEHRKLHGGRPLPNAEVHYVRDAFEYGFKRKSTLPAGLDPREFPETFAIQHTVDRNMRVQDVAKGREEWMPWDARANEVKSPVGYAKLYLSALDRRRAAYMREVFRLRTEGMSPEMAAAYARESVTYGVKETRALIDMGLHDYVKLMDEFYDIYGNGLKSAEVPADLKGRFEFIDGKGKMSHGIRLHEAVESKPPAKPLKPVEPEKPNPWKEGMPGFNGWGS